MRKWTLIRIYLFSVILDVLYEPGSQMAFVGTCTDPSLILMNGLLGSWKKIYKLKYNIFENWEWVLSRDIDIFVRRSKNLGITHLQNDLSYFSLKLTLLEGFSLGWFENKWALSLINRNTVFFYFKKLKKAHTLIVLNFLIDRATTTAMTQMKRMTMTSTRNQDWRVMLCRMESCSDAIARCLSRVSWSENIGIISISEAWISKTPFQSNENTFRRVRFRFVMIKLRPAQR